MQRLEQHFFFLVIKLILLTPFVTSSAETCQVVPGCSFTAPLPLFTTKQRFPDITRMHTPSAFTWGKGTSINNPASPSLSRKTKWSPPTLGFFSAAVQQQHLPPPFLSIGHGRIFFSSSFFTDHFCRGTTKFFFNGCDQVANSSPNCSWMAHSCQGRHTCKMNRTIAEETSSNIYQCNNCGCCRSLLSKGVRDHRGQTRRNFG